MAQGHGSGFIILPPSGIDDLAGLGIKFDTFRPAIGAAQLAILKIEDGLDPACLKIGVAGGPGKHSAYINSGHTRRTITRKIVFPRDWRALLDKYRE
jgi:hypothetical protein